jgi:hypothetical protein
MTTRTLDFGKNTWPSATDYPGETNDFADDITGTAAANLIFLGGGDDKVDAAGGNDTVEPGEGQDEVRLGAGTDTVRYQNHLESSAVAPDLLVDFTTGEDLLNLKNIDANAILDGDQDFNLVNGANPGAPFTNVAGQYRIDPNTGRLEGDRDGNGTADFVIQFGNQLPDPGSQVFADFVLPDFDGDGVPDEPTDLDGDGILDIQVDTDGDGQPDGFEPFTPSPTTIGGDIIG